MTGNKSSLLIIGIGNIYRQDDAIGIECARIIKRDLPELDTIEISDDLTTLINKWNKRDVVIIDAVKSDQKQIFEFYSTEEIITFSDIIRNTHSIGLEQVLNMSTELSISPNSIYFIGIPSLCYKLGKKMNQETKDRIPEIIQKIIIHAQNF